MGTCRRPYVRLQHHLEKMMDEAFERQIGQAIEAMTTAMNANKGYHEFHLAVDLSIPPRLADLLLRFMAMSARTGLTPALEALAAYNGEKTT